jgi:hypothetical protein
VVTATSTWDGAQAVPVVGPGEGGGGQALLGHAVGQEPGVAWLGAQEGGGAGQGPVEVGPVEVGPVDVGPVEVAWPQGDGQAAQGVGHGWLAEHGGGQVEARGQGPGEQPEQGLGHPAAGQGGGQV